ADDELECKICYQRFMIHSRKPKILDCLHRMCTGCLTKILQIGEGSPCISCPFCRHETDLHENEVEGLPNDTNTMSKLILKDKTEWNSDCQEVILTPKNLVYLSSSHGSNCLVITIMEVQRDSPRTPSPSTTSNYCGGCGTESLSLSSQSHLDQDLFSKLWKRVPRILLWLFGFLYFSSLPLGIYLLVLYFSIQKETLGAVCVSFVPSSLTACLMFCFCQCLCHGICDCSS
ncbi:E3 ubiquitin-protein ligase RNF182, partial [Mesitornis unicolor]